MSIRVPVDIANPGQYFACCGLLELASRLGDGAKGWFAEGGQFQIDCDFEIDHLVQSLRQATLTQVDIDDNTGTPITIGDPFRELRLDWWQDERSGGKDLKVWAGTMESYRIATAMQNAIRAAEFLTDTLFNVGVIAYDPADPTKKVEPYYFDARRAPNAHSRDVGFSPNDLSMTTTAFPAVELLCLVGLQRCLPPNSDPNNRRIFDYYTWAVPLPPELMPVAVSGLLPHIGQRGYRFENWFRTGQRKHKAFRPAVSLTS